MSSPEPIPGLLWRWPDCLESCRVTEDMLRSRAAAGARSDCGSPDLSDPLTALWHHAQGVPADLRALAEEVLTPDGRREAGDELARAVLAGEGVREAALALLTALDEHEDEAEMNNRDDYTDGAGDGVYAAKAALRAALEAK